MTFQGPVSVHIEDSTVQQFAALISGADSRWPVVFATGALNATMYLASWAAASYKDRFAADTLLSQARSELEKLDRLLHRPLTEEDQLKIQAHLASDRDLIRIESLREIGDAYFRAVEGLEDDVRESGALQRYAWWSQNCKKARDLVKDILDYRQDVYNSTKPIRHNTRALPQRARRSRAEDELRAIAASAQQLRVSAQDNTSVTFSISDDSLEMDVTAMV